MTSQEMAKRLPGMRSTSSELSSTSTVETKPGEHIETPLDLNALANNRREEAIKQLQSQFGECDPLGIARIIFALTKRRCNCSSYNCCLRNTRGTVVNMKWTCFTALYPGLSLHLDQVAEDIQGLKKFLNMPANNLDTVYTLTESYSWDINWSMQFAISPLDARWPEIKEKIRRTLSNYKEGKRQLLAQSEMIDSVFEEYTEHVIKAIDRNIQALQDFLLKMYWKEVAMEDCLNDFTIGIDPPTSHRDNHIAYRSTYPPSYTEQQDRAKMAIQEVSNAAGVATLGLSDCFDRRAYRFRMAYMRFKSRLGEPRVMWLIMTVLCTAAIVAIILAVYKTTSVTSAPLPVIDSNFWSSLSQSNLAFAAIYSVLYPQLQGNGDSVPAERRWMFNGLLVSSVLTAAIATCVYPWHSATSIVASFIASLTQLAVTLMIILGAKQRITELEYMVRR